MSVTAYIDSNNGLHISNNEFIIAAGMYHYQLKNQRVQVNGNVVKVIGEEVSHGNTSAYCYRIGEYEITSSWIEYF